MSREKVFDDPLAMFGGDSEASTSTTSTPVISNPVTVPTEEFKSLKIDKVNVKVKKEKAVSKSLTETAENEKKSKTAMSGFGSAGDGNGIFGSAKVESIDDFLADLSVNEPKSGGNLNNDDGMFAAGTVFKNTVIGQNPSSTGSKAKANADATQKRKDYSNLHVNDSNDDKVHDLTVGRMLQREEYDYDTYGQSNVKQGGYTVKPSAESAKADANIKKQLQELDQLEQLMNTNESSTSVTAKKPAVASGSGLGLFDTPVESTEPAAIDYNNMNLDDYINSQQTEDSGGGLFD